MRFLYRWFRDRLFDEGRTFYKTMFRRRSIYHEEDLSDQPFFIIGSGRSGSTVLRAMLTNHPDIVIPPESGFLWEVIREYTRLSFLPWSMLHRVVLGLIIDHQEFYTWDLDEQKLYERVGSIPQNKRTLYSIVKQVYDEYREKHQPGATIWGDKTPLNTEFLHLINQLFPKAKYIHIVRDGRDVATSYRRSGLAESLQEGVNKWRQALEHVKELKHRIESDRYIEIRYESLVKSPEDQLNVATDFLNTEYNDKMLDFWKNADELGDVPEYDFHSQISKPLNEEAIGRWQNLEKTEQKFLKNELSDVLRRYDYS